MASANSHSLPQPQQAEADHELFHAALLLWLALGCVALLLFPSLRAADPQFGWLPFWLVIAPLIDLAVLRRKIVMTLLRSFVASRHRSRGRHKSVSQAKPLRRRASRPRQNRVPHRISQ